VSQVAVQDLNGQATVFVEKDAGRFEARAVEVGRTMEGMVQILRGLKAGERVVAGGSFILKSQLLKATLSGE
jgi:cobalt-zinc-cadmium efflux system membrane fusion protein